MEKRGMQRHQTVETGSDASQNRNLAAFVVLACAVALAAWFRADIARAAIAAYEQVAARLQRPGDGPPVSAPSAGHGATRPDATQSTPVVPSVADTVREAPAAADTAVPLPPLPRLYPVPRTAPAPPAGREGLVHLLRSGAMRVASGGDIARWSARYAQAHGRPPGPDFEDRLGMTQAYVITGDVTLPAGLTGAHSVVLLLERGAPHPAGDPGHSPLLDIASGACLGVTCGMLLE